jgi:hypothetical protein
MRSCYYARGRSTFAQMMAASGNGNKKRPAARSSGPESLAAASSKGLQTPGTPQDSGAESLILESRTPVRSSAFSSSA